MKHKRITMSIVLATLMLVSLFAVVSSAASASGQASGTSTKLVGGILAGTGPGLSNKWKNSYENDVFAVDATGALWYKSIYNDGVWSPLGGVCTASPAAVSWDGNNRMDVFVRGTDGALYHKWFDGRWSAWERLGGVIYPGTGPAVSSWGSGRLDVFVEGMDGALYQKWFDKGWHDWVRFDGYLTSSPTAASGSNRVDVFVRGGDGAVWHKNWNGAWSGWTSLGGQLAPNTGPAVNFYSYNLFVQGTDHQLWRMYISSTSPGTSWTLSGKPPEALSASSPASSNVVTMDHTVLCVSTTSGNIWWSADSLGNWNYWYSVGSPP